VQMSAPVQTLAPEQADRRHTQQSPHWQQSSPKASGIVVGSVCVF